MPTICSSFQTTWAPIFLKKVSLWDCVNWFAILQLWVMWELPHWITPGRFMKSDIRIHLLLLINIKCWQKQVPLENVPAHKMRFRGPGKTVGREILLKSQPIIAGRKYKTFFDLFLFAKALWEMYWLDTSYLDKTSAYFSLLLPTWKMETFIQNLFISSLEISNVPMVSKPFILIISFHSHSSVTKSLKKFLQLSQGLPNLEDKYLFTAMGLSFDTIEL